MSKAKFSSTERQYIESVTEAYTECETPKTADEIAEFINLKGTVKEIVTRFLINDIRRKKKLHVKTTVRRAKYQNPEQFDHEKVDVPKAHKTFRDLIAKITECGKLAEELRDAMKGHADKSFFF